MVIELGCMSQSISDQSGDSDLDNGDTVISRGWPRNEANLAKHGLRPVWTSYCGYSDSTIPSDIEEYLYENITYRM